MKGKFITASLVVTSFLLASTASVFAHVAVTPNEVGVAKFQTFTVGVPTEKDNPTAALRLLLPEGLQEVTPNVKPGWSIEVKKNGENATEIDWTGGTIPAGQRDEFSFSSQAPSKTTTLQWKAYQIYADKSVISWDETPKGSDDATGDKGPYSETKVINDLAASSSTDTNQLNTWTSFAALGLAIVALGVSLMKNKTK